MAGRHLSLVVSISRNFAYNRERIFDEDRQAEMVGVGNLALMQCMDRYVHTPGQHFVRFAARCVTNAMIGEMMANIRSDTGRSYRMQRTLLEIDAEYQKALEAGIDIGFLEVGEKLGYSQERVQRILSLSQKKLHSLDDQVVPQQDGGYNLEEVIEDPRAQASLTAIEDKIQIDKIWAVAHELKRQQVITDPEWEIFISRFRDGITQEAIAQSWESGKTQSGVSWLEQQVLNKIRKEIEQPGAHEKTSDASLRIVESAVDLLDILEIPIKKGMDILGIARTVLNNVRLTAWQREVMHALIGTSGKHFRPKEFARTKGRTHRAIYDAREKAVRNILATWAEMPSAERSTVLCATVDTFPTFTSRGPKPNTTESAILEPSNQPVHKNLRRLSKGEVLERAIKLKPVGRMTKKEVTALAEQGIFLSVDELEGMFGGWSGFQSLCSQLRQQMRR